MFNSKALSLFAQWVPFLALFPFLMPELEKSYLAPFVFFLAVIVTDNGHIIITLFRILTKNRALKEKLFYLGITLASITLTWLWLVLKIPYFWSFFLYFTAYHHMKQNLGLFAWLSKSEKSQIPYLKFYSYACFLLPFVFFHLRTDIQTESIIYGLLKFPEFMQTASIPPGTLRMSGHLLTGGLLLSAFGLFMIDWLKQRKIRTGIYVISITALNVFSMIYGRNFYEVYVPLILCHGMTYFLATSDSLVKVQKYSVLQSVTLVVLTAFTYGIVDWYLQEEGFAEYSVQSLPTWMLLGIALTAGLNIAHYTIDGFVWKRSDVDYKTIHSTS